MVPRSWACFPSHLRTAFSGSSTYTRLTHIFKSRYLMLAVNQSTPKKRAMCLSCSKPLRLCLCSRIKTPRLDNSVGITILQHNLEKKHALNTVRIAKLGLKNISVANVSDVIFDARIIIHLLKSGPSVGSGHIAENFGDNPERLGRGLCGLSVAYPKEQTNEFVDADGIPMCVNAVGNCHAFGGNKDVLNSKSRSEGVSHNLNGWPQELDPDPVLNFTLTKCGGISSFSHQMTTKLPMGLNFEQFLASKDAESFLAKQGFSVKKLQKRQLHGSKEIEEYEEFNIVFPPGTVLLFPSQRSVGVEAMNFDVKHLIILDGTWRKAKRIYIENPWLKLLPHLKLDLYKMSLYGEVRRQPKAGYLSTIESMVYALKSLGDSDAEVLDHLLEVFDSMVVDQRRCKEEAKSLQNKPQEGNR